MTDESKDLLVEIESIKSQYTAEVHGKRRPWPESVKTRVLQLCKTGHYRQKELSRMTGISYASILEWRRSEGLPLRKYSRNRPKPKPKFKSLAVRPNSDINRTVRDKNRSDRQSSVKVEVQGGYRVEFENPEEAADFFRALKGNR